MKQKHSKIKSYTFGALALFIVLITAVGLATLKHSQTKAAPVAKVPTGAAVPSQFSFTGATDWTQGATRMTDMALFHKYDCFTSIQHKTGSIAADEVEHQKTLAQLVSDGYTITPGASVAVTLQTNAGPQVYQLMQSSIVPPVGGEKIKGGVEHGYVQLPSGYLYIEGNCDTPEQLPSTIPALQAIKFDAAKSTVKN